MNVPQLVDDANQALQVITAESANLEVMVRDYTGMLPAGVQAEMTAASLAVRTAVHRLARDLREINVTVGAR